MLTQQVVQQALISFDQSGNLTTVATGNYQPKIATQDGGVIAQASDGSTVAFGTNLSLAALRTYPYSHGWGTRTSLAHWLRLCFLLLNWQQAFGHCKAAISPEIPRQYSRPNTRHLRAATLQIILVHLRVQVRGR